MLANLAKKGPTVNGPYSQWGGRAGDPSPGRYSHLVAPYYISLLILYTKYNKMRLNDFNIYA